MVPFVSRGLYWQRFLRVYHRDETRHTILSTNMNATVDALRAELARRFRVPNPADHALYLQKTSLGMCLPVAREPAGAGLAAGAHLS
jgi:hypothetical protein